MPARAQSNFYPAATIDEVCNGCYASESVCSCGSGSNQNSTYCGTCNVDCNTQQSYCALNMQTITQHGDVGSFGGFGANLNDIIYQKWTHTLWNRLQDNFLTADRMGISEPQGAGFGFTPAAQGHPTPPINPPYPANSLVTAAQYNQFSTAAAAFSAAIPAVNQGDIIKATHSAALETGYAAGQFRNTVCDICNGTASQHNCGYNCSCNYNCCNYNCCNYDCSYDCCNYNCGTADV